MNVKIVFQIAVLFAILASVPVHSYEVGMNFVYKIGQDKAETIHVNGSDYSAGADARLAFSGLADKYISSRRGSSIFSVMFAGNEFISAGFNSSYSSGAYMLQMAQGSRGNRFIIGFSNTTQNRLDESMPVIDAHKLILTTISGVKSGFVPSGFFLRLEPDAEIYNYIKWSGAVNLLIKNNGISAGRHNLSFEV